MEQEILSQLVEFIKNASPTVWGILLKQVYVNATSFLIWFFILLFISFALFKLGNYGRKKSKEDNDDIGWFIGYLLSYICSGTLLIVSLSNFTDAMVRFANPEFYVIQFILNSLR